jgi:hypothetical protein
MVGYDQVTAFRNGLGDNGFRTVERGQNTRNGCIGITDKQSGVVVRLLVGEGRERLKKSGYVANGWHRERVR